MGRFKDRPSNRNTDRKSYRQTDTYRLVDKTDKQISEKKDQTSIQTDRHVLACMHSDRNRDTKFLHECIFPGGSGVVPSDEVGGPVPRQPPSASPPPSGSESEQNRTEQKIHIHIHTQIFFILCRIFKN